MRPTIHTIHSSYNYQMFRLSHCLPSSSINCAQIRNIYRYSARSRKTGRGCGNYVKPSQEWRFTAATERTFTRLNGRKYGFDMGLEDRLILLSLGQKNRRLDGKKMGQLAKIYEEKLIELIASHEILGEHSIKISKVKVNNSLTEVTVYWLCNGVNDELLSTLLSDHSHSLRRQLGLSIGSTTPEVKFVADRTEVMAVEMDRLFMKADYGVDYRTLSKTARIMGNAEKREQREEETQRKERKKIPEWRMKWEEKQGIKRKEEEKNE